MKPLQKRLTYMSQNTLTSFSELSENLLRQGDDEMSITGMKIGYARTSTAEQVAGLEAQERDLLAAGCDKVFSEQVSGTATVRPQLNAALDFIREGDVLVVTKPDRLARSTADMLEIVRRVEAKGASLLVQSVGGQVLDTRSPTGKLMLTVLAAVATFERDLMKERQCEGIAKAKSEGRYKGRAPTVRRRADEIAELKAQGLGPAEIARQLGVGRASVYRALAEVVETEAA
jgi:DNA invertase Pin-like site-specific DNA recombinase